MKVLDVMSVNSGATTRNSVPLWPTRYSSPDSLSPKDVISMVVSQPLRRGAAGRGHRPDPPAAEVPEDVQALEIALAGPAIDGPARDRAVARPVGAQYSATGRVRPDWSHRTAVEAVVPFHRAPAVVPPPGPLGGWRSISSYVAAPDVGDPEVVGRPIERQAPGVAQAEGPDRVVPGLADERVVGWVGDRRRCRPRPSRPRRCAGSCRAACRCAGRSIAGRLPRRHRSRCTGSHRARRPSGRRCDWSGRCARW